MRTNFSLNRFPLVLSCKFFLAILLLPFGVTQVGAQASNTNSSETPGAKETNPSPVATTTPPFPLKVIGVRTPNARDNKITAGLGDKVVLKIQNLNKELTRQDNLPSDVPRIEPSKFVLFLQKVEISKLYPTVNRETDELSFTLTRSAESRDAWLDLLASPKEPERIVDATVGPEGKAPIEGGAAFTLRIYNQTWFRWGVVGFGIALLFFLYLAKTTAIIRDSGPPTPVGGALARPYSLGRVQVAWWFFIILGSFLFIALVTWDFDTITTSSLVLLGIGTGTALGGAMVDANKRESTNSDLRILRPQQAKLAGIVEELRNRINPLALKEQQNPPTLTDAERASLGSWRTELAAKEAELEQVNIQVSDASAAQENPITKGIVPDLLSDANGIAFHRFQILVWTIVLGLIFICSVWKRLSMPEFSDTLLALMGISAGTYIGFKIPERQTSPEDAVGAGDPGAGEAAAAAAEAAANSERVDE